MNTIILYKSKYGSTKRYAQWLADELQCGIAEAGTLSVSQLDAYDCIIFGGGIFASGVKSIKWFKKTYSRLHGKQVAVFAVGASPANEKDIEECRTRSLSPELEGVPFFYLRGAWNEPDMTFFDRKLCGLLKSEIAKKPQGEREGWETALLEVYSEGNNGVFDWASKEQLEPLFKWHAGLTS